MCVVGVPPDNYPRIKPLALLIFGLRWNLAFLFNELLKPEVCCN